MKPKDFKRLLVRDGGRCPHCGEMEALAPNHRINRGMGGSKVLDFPANYVLLCSIMNGQIEADHRWAALAESYGWKLKSWQNPLTEPVFDTLTGEWRLLDNNWGFIVITQKKSEPPAHNK